MCINKFRLSDASSFKTCPSARPCPCVYTSACASPSLRLASKTCFTSIEVMYRFSYLGDRKGACCASQTAIITQQHIHGHGLVRPLPRRYMQPIHNDRRWSVDSTIGVPFSRSPAIRAAQCECRSGPVGGSRSPMADRLRLSPAVVG